MVFTYRITQGVDTFRVNYFKSFYNYFVKINSGQLRISQERATFET